MVILGYVNLSGLKRLTPGSHVFFGAELESQLDTSM